MGARIAAFCCGVMILYSGWLAPEFLVLVIPALLFLMWRRPQPDLVLVIPFLLGLLVSAGAVSWQRTAALPATLEGIPLQVSGYICEVPVPGSFRGVRFSLCVTDWHRSDGLPETSGRLPSRIRLNWYSDQASLAPPSPLTATVVLKRPHGALNPGGFRYETWLFRKNYGATGSIRALSAAPDPGCGVLCQYHRLRTDLVRHLETRLDNMEHRGLALSLMVGYRGELKNADWEVLQATGTVHLVAISGLHLGMVAAMVAGLGRGLVLCSPVRRWPSSRQRLLIFTLVLLASIVYALLAGFTVPTRRALIMVAVAGWFIYRGVLLGPWQGWLAALVIVLFLDPWSSLDQGFWLSFAAVAILILVFSRRVIVTHPLIALPLAQIAIFAGLWPLLSFMQLPSELAGLPANLLAIPWFTFVIMPAIALTALLLQIPGGELVALPVLDLSLGIMWTGLEWIGGGSWPVIRLPASATLILAALMMLALWWPDNRFRAVLAFCSVAVVTGWTISQRQATNPWLDAPEVWVWDVGQGLSVMLRHQDQVLFYDTGPGVPSGYNAVDAVLLPSLRELGVKSVDTLVVSHGDMDHAGGLSSLVQAFPRMTLISGEPERLVELNPGLSQESVAECTTGRRWQVGDVEVYLWQIDPGDLARQPDGNDSSCVLVARYQGVELLLPGDISRRVESHFLTWPEIAQGDSHFRILVAPHHGSITSSRAEWVAQLQPEIVVFTAGYRHHYGHPHPDVVARYRQAGARLFNTALTGALRIEWHGYHGSEGSPVTVTGLRERAPFWIRRSEPVPE